MENLVYIVEDEGNIRELICASLRSAGFQTMDFEQSRDFFKHLTKTTPELVILDIMLPEESGLEILKKLKKIPEYKNIPVIFLTAKSTELDKVTGLDLGADDFIIKPFGVLELISRTKAVLRRYRMLDRDISDEEWLFKDLHIHTGEKAVYKNGNKINLTFKEFELLLYLYKNKGIVISRNKLLENVWSYDFEGETRTVDSHIRSLRQKIGDNTEKPFYIATIRGHGYMMLKE